MGYRLLFSMSWMCKPHLLRMVKMILDYRHTDKIDALVNRFYLIDLIKY
jgi:hypothetical protein